MPLLIIFVNTITQDTPYPIHCKNFKNFFFLPVFTRIVFFMTQEELII